MAVEIVLGKTVQSSGAANQFGDFFLVLLGAAIASATSFLVQRYSHRKAVAETDKRRMEDARADALIGVFKLGEIINALHGFKVSFAEMASFAKAKESGPLGRCLFYSPLIGGSESHPKFEGREVLFLLEAGEPSLVNDVYLAERKLESVVSIVSKYNELRANLSSDLEKFQEGVGDDRLVSLKFSKDVMLRLKPKAMALDRLIDEVEMSVNDALEHSLNVSERISAAGKKYFGKDKFLQLQAKQREVE